VPAIFYDKEVMDGDMLTFNIYKNKEKIASKSFKNHFYICRRIDTDELFWETDEEQSSSKEGGIIHIWIMSAQRSPKISFVRADWKMIVDGVEFKQDFYTEVDVQGKTVELQYKDYQFVCSFK